MTTKYKMNWYKNIYIRVLSICILNLCIIVGMIRVIHVRSNEAVQKEYINSLDASLNFHATTLKREVENAISMLNVLTVNDSVRRYLYNYEVLSTYERHSVEQEIKDLFAQFSCMNGLIRNIGIISGERDRGISGEDKDNIPSFFPNEINETLLRYGNRLFLIKTEKSKKRPNTIFYIELNNKFLKDLAKSIQAVVPSAHVAILQRDSMFYETSGFPQLNKREKIFKYPIYFDEIELLVAFESPIQANSVKSLNYIICVVIFIIAIFGFVLVLYIHYVLNRPMKKLMLLMREVEKGNFNLQVSECQDDQFGYIFKGFQNMIDSLNGYILKTYNQQLAIERSELKQLQAQINPHFLYNCFFNITNLCRIEDVDTAMIFSQKLATYYMYITRNKRDLVMLKEEYQHACDYLEIQNIRFYNKVNMEITPLTGEQERLRVPKIILQPILENCYKYVFEKNEEVGTLRMHVEYEGNVLKIVVEDSGYLLEDITIWELKNQIASTDEEIEHTGIINVNKRLKLKNTLNGIEVTRSALGGLKVEITITY